MLVVSNAVVKWVDKHLQLGEALHMSTCGLNLIQAAAGCQLRKH